MKVLVLSVLCVLVGGAFGGAVSWPPTAFALRTPYVKTVIPAHTKSFGYSTTQYINTLPASYSVGLQPQLAYHIPHQAGIAGLPLSYYPVGDLSYYPASIFYPPVGAVIPGSHPATVVPGSPAAPGVPVAPSQPSLPSQPPSPPLDQAPGDADTAVVDSADFPSDQQRLDQPAAPPSQPQSTPLPPASTFPSYPNVPQIPQGSGQVQYPQLPQGSGQIQLPQFPQAPGQIQYPQLPQGPGQIQLPQIPQAPGQIQYPQIPQFPQGSLPSLPQLPQSPLNPSNPFFPPSPGSSPSTFPGSVGGDKGLNDEDTISVESA